MNLIVDVGNTLIKLAVFENGQLVEKRICAKANFFEDVESLMKAFPRLSHGIISSVGSFNKENYERLRTLLPMVELSHECYLPFINAYKSPATLGVDRIALVSAAAIQFPDENVLIIDAGSCITYDVLNNENVYEGGAISPGMRLRYKAMNDHTDKLPLLVARGPKNIVGNTTEESMHIGVIEGITREIDGFIDAYIEKYDTLTIIFTGGDAEMLRDRLKNDTFANSNFLLEGLQNILELNKD